MRWVGPGGWGVEVTEVAGREAFRVTWLRGWFVGYCYSPAELERLLRRSGVELGDLVEEPGA